MSDTSKLIFVAQVAASFGLAGEFKLLSYTQNPLDILRYKTLKNEKGEIVLTLTKAKSHKGAILAGACGITDKTQADALKGLKLYISRTDLPKTDEDDFYISDLLGLKVRGEDGQDAGLIKAVENFGAGDLLEIQPPEGPSYYLGFTLQNVPHISIPDGFVTIVTPQLN